VNENGEPIAAVPIPGNLTVYPIQSSPESHGGYLSFWDNARKHQAFSGAHTGGDGLEFYIEGVHESLDPGDVGVEVIFTPDGGGAQWSNIYNLTVTPLITSFTATPLDGQPNVEFRNRTNTWSGDSRDGLRASQSNAAGPWGSMRFTAEVTGRNISGGIAFVNELTADINGANSGEGHGWVFRSDAMRAPWDMVIEDWVTDSYPFLDTDVRSPDGITYPLDATEVTQDGDGVKIYAADMPFSGVVTDPQGETQCVDLKMCFELFLVCKYTDGSIYAIASTNWSVNFYATGDVPTLGATDILDPNGVRSDGSFTRSNADPRTGGTLGNDATDWYEA
jgi:hypothetical protein